MAQIINIDSSAIAGKAVNAYSKDRVNDSADISLSSDDSASNYIFDGAPSKQTQVNKTMDQFEEYLKNQQEKAKESGEDEASQEKADKEAAKEIRNNLSSEEIKQLSMMGVDVESARLSDIMGMVNTMRGKNHREETQELFAQIKADSGDVDKLVVTGDGVKVAGTDVSLDNVSVADVAEEESKASLTKTAQEVAGDVRAQAKASDEDFTPGKNELAYMVKNNLALNRENLYKAHFSGVQTTEGAMDDKVFEAVSSQVEGIIEETGIDNFDMDDARFLLDNELPVNADSIKLVAQFKEIEGQDIDSLDIPEDDDESVIQAAQELYKKVLFVEPETVQELAGEMSISGREVSIQAAYSYQTGGLKSNRTDSDVKKEKSDKASETKRNIKDDELAGTMTAAGVTAKRQLLELQLSMTLKVANRMAKLDINVDTKGLSETLDTLRQAERELLKESLANSGVEPTDENADMLSETIAGVEKLGSSDASVLAAPLRGSAFTVRGLNAAENVLTEEASIENAGNADDTQDELRQNLQKSFESVRRSYEAVGTAPRSDMGDSITKAFSNVDELLGELDIDVNYETQRAAKILGYNNLEITQENIDGVISYDREVNRLMDSFYPEAVMGLIKDGINPMDIPIDELNDIISAKNYNEGVTEAKNFATYLRDVEKRGEITDEERESYIGIYRVMDKLEKSGDREAGFVFANQANLTIRNMISAMRSRRAKGMDVDIDDSFGMLESLEKSVAGMDDQIEAGFGSGAGAQTEEADSEILRSLEQYRSLDENVERFIQENGIEYNMTNAFAVDAFLNENEGVYKLIYEAMSRMKFDDMSEENLIDEETGNMAASMMGDEVEVDPLEGLESETLLRQLGENGDLSLTYDDIRSRLTELMYDAGAAGRITSLDISAIKSASAGVNLLSTLSKQDRYQIPVETKQGTTVVNLTMKNAADRASGSAMGGSTPGGTGIKAYMRTENLGNLTASLELAANADGGITVKGQFVTDTAAGNEALQGMTDVMSDFQRKLEEILSTDSGDGSADGEKNINIDISFGTLPSAGAAGAQAADGDAKSALSKGVACRVAVDVVKTMSELANEID